MTATITCYMAGSQDDYVNTTKPFRLPTVELQICHDQGLTTTDVWDVKQALQKAQGRIGPGGFVMEAYDGTIIYDYFDLVLWIEKNGLRQC